MSLGLILELIGVFVGIPGSVVSVMMIHIQVKRWWHLRKKCQSQEPVLKLTTTSLSDPLS